MPPDRTKCIALFSANEDNEKLADLLEETFPSCNCELVSVGDGSPGQVSDDEVLVRIIVSPRDIDETGRIANRPFEKVFANGLSVCRDIAPDDDILILANEGMGVAGSSVRALLTADVGAIRAQSTAGERAFCIYDQTVSRNDNSLQPVATHASIFLRLPPKGTPERKRIRKDYAYTLRDMFLRGQVDLSAYRNGILDDKSGVGLRVTTP